jgi:hypothetical protein
VISWERERKPEMLAEEVPEAAPAREPGDDEPEPEPLDDVQPYPLGP